MSDLPVEKRQFLKHSVFPRVFDDKFDVQQPPSQNFKLQVELVARVEVLVKTFVGFRFHLGRLHSS
jgi:hypothetical protein